MWWQRIAARVRSRVNHTVLHAAFARSMDVVVALVLLAMFSPVVLVVGVVIAVSYGRPILFVQRRVGRGGALFDLFKFRTMCVDAPASGSAVTIGIDRRITHVGHVLRRYKLDELPQFFNVLRGDMSLIGPRPEVEKYVANYTEEQRRVLDVRPGITDPASLYYRDEAALLATFTDPERAYVEVVLPHKLSMSIEYLRTRTVLSDLCLLVRTAGEMLRPSAAKEASTWRRAATLRERV